MAKSTPVRINEDGELEKQCGVCKEWWPLDSEFFSTNGTGKLASPCRACKNDITIRWRTNRTRKGRIAA